MVPHIVPLFGAQRKPHKNRERGGALALGGHNLIMQCNNQPKFGGSGRWDVMAEQMGGERGMTIQLFGAANGATKNK